MRVLRVAWVAPADADAARTRAVSRGIPLGDLVAWGWVCAAPAEGEAAGEWDVPLAPPAAADWGLEGSATCFLESDERVAEGGLLGEVGVEVPGSVVDWEEGWG